MSGVCCDGDGAFGVGVYGGGAALLLAAAEPPPRFCAPRGALLCGRFCAGGLCHCTGEPLRAEHTRLCGGQRGLYGMVGGGYAAVYAAEYARQRVLRGLGAAGGRDRPRAVADAGVDGRTAVALDLCARHAARNAGAVLPAAALHRRAHHAAGGQLPYRAAPAGQRPAAERHFCGAERGAAVPARRGRELGAGGFGGFDAVVLPDAFVSADRAV